MLLSGLLLFSCWIMSDSLGTPWTVAPQAPLSMGFPRQEYWSGLPFPTLGDLLDPGIQPASPAFTGGFCTMEPPRKFFIRFSLQRIYSMKCSNVYSVCDTHDQRVCQSPKTFCPFTVCQARGPRGCCALSVPVTRNSDRDRGLSTS